MRALFLSNFYPPTRAGGYAQLCQEVAQGLQTKGHTVHVLTSNYRREQAPVDEVAIHRRLHLEADLFYYRPLDFFLHWKKNQQENHAHLVKVVDECRPDVLVIWGMWALSKSLPALAEALLPSRVVYYLAAYWPVAEDMHTAYWRQPTRRWVTRLPKQFLRTIATTMLAGEGQPDLKFEHVLCVSGALRDILIERGLCLANTQVVYNGIDVEPFVANHEPEQARRTGRRLELLYAGQVVPSKGVHTTIEAMAALMKDGGIEGLHLTVVGGGHPDYEARLHALVAREGLHNYVTFRAPVPRDEMPAILEQSDVLLFPSIYEEPLARIVQEAMAAGVVVVGTTTGGTQEILVEGENGLTFAPDDAPALAAQVARLAADPDLCHRLAQNGRRTVLEKFTMSRMVSEVDTYLQDIIRRNPRTVSPAGHV